MTNSLQELPIKIKVTKLPQMLRVRASRQTVTKEAHGSRLRLRRTTGGEGQSRPGGKGLRSTGGEGQSRPGDEGLRSTGGEGQNRQMGGATATLGATPRARDRVALGVDVLDVEGLVAGCAATAPEAGLKLKTGLALDVEGEGLGAAERVRSRPAPEPDERPRRSRTPADGIGSRGALDPKRPQMASDLLRSRGSIASSRSSAGKATFIPSLMATRSASTLFASTASHKPKRAAAFFAQACSVRASSASASFARDLSLRASSASTSFARDLSLRASSATAFASIASRAAALPTLPLPLRSSSATAPEDGPVDALRSSES